MCPLCLQAPRSALEPSRLPASPSLLKFHHHSAHCRSLSHLSSSWISVGGERGVMFSTVCTFRCCMPFIFILLFERRDIKTDLHLICLYVESCCSIQGCSEKAKHEESPNTLESEEIYTEILIKHCVVCNWDLKKHWPKNLLGAQWLGLGYLPSGSRMCG